MRDEGRNARCRFGTLEVPAYYLLLATPQLPLNTYHSPPTTYCFTLTTYNILLTYSRCRCLPSTPTARRSPARRRQSTWQARARRRSRCRLPGYQPTMLPGYHPCQMRARRRPRYRLRSMPCTLCPRCPRPTCPPVSDRARISTTSKLSTASGRRVGRWRGVPWSLSPAWGLTRSATAAPARAASSARARCRCWYPAPRSKTPRYAAWRLTLP